MKKHIKEVYIYNEEFELVKMFPTTLDAARFFKEPYLRFKTYVRAHPYIIFDKYGLIPSREFDIEKAKEAYAYSIAKNEERNKSRKDLIKDIGEGLCRNRECLQTLADYEQIYINWEKWDKLVEKTKEDIRIALEGHQGGKHTRVYIYNKDFQLVYTFYTIKECAEYFNYSTTTINNLLKKDIPWSKEERFYFSRLDMDDIHQLKEKVEEKQNNEKVVKNILDKVQKLEHQKGYNSPIFVYSLKGELLGKYISAKDTAKEYGISPEQVGVYLRGKKPYKKLGLIFTQQKLR